MTQAAQSYSAREGIANALRTYQRAIQTYQDQEKRAMVERQAAEQQARRIYEEQSKQGREFTDMEKTNAQHMLTEVDALFQQVDQLLQQAELSKRVAIPRLQPTGAGKGRPPKQEMQSHYAQVRAAETDLRRAVADWEHYRKTFIAQLRKTLGLSL